MSSKLRLKRILHATLSLAITASALLVTIYSGIAVHRETIEEPRSQIRELAQLSKTLSAKQSQFLREETTTSSTDLAALRRDFLSEAKNSSPFALLQNRIRALAQAHGATLTSSREIRPSISPNTTSQPIRRVAVNVSFHAKTAALMSFLVALENARPLLMVVDARITANQALRPGARGSKDRISADLTVVAFVFSNTSHSRDDAS